MSAPALLRRRAPTAPALAALTALAAGACSPDAALEERPVVVATIFPIGDLAAEIAGDAARIEVLLPPRASIHTWEATPGQIRSLGEADGFITVGGGLDGWLEEMGADVEGLTTLRVTDGMALRRAGLEHAHDHATPHGEGAGSTGDPHVWLDPILVRDEIVPRIRDLLADVSPERAEDVRARAGALADSLTALDAEIRAILAGRRGDDFVATHDAWAYFAARYGLAPLGNLYESPGHEPSARGLAALVDAARASGLRSVLSEPQLSETAAEALAGELGASVVMVDPMGGPGLEGRERYLALMRFNARAFARALGTP